MGVQLNISKNTFVVFDLDDTLYKELSYVQSAFKEISQKIADQNAEKCYHSMMIDFERGKNVFDCLINKYGNQEFTIKSLLNQYRNHFPNIKLDIGIDELITGIHTKARGLGLITDGRSLTQRNKINALGISKYFDSIVISEEFGSEKPNEANYLFFEQKYVSADFTYIGDNTEKDFIAPNKLGWDSICILDSGTNIHHQNLELDQIYLPKRYVSNALEIEIIVEE